MRGLVGMINMVQNYEKAYIYILDSARLHILYEG